MLGYWYLFCSEVRVVVYKYLTTTEVPVFDVNKRDSNLGPLPELNKSIISDKIVSVEELLRNTAPIESAKIEEVEDPLIEVDLDLSPYFKGEKGHLLIFIEATKVTHILRCFLTF